MSSTENDPERVMSFSEWCKLCGFSEATGRRVLAEGKGPKVTWLSERRMGIRRRHHIEWLDEKAAAA
jgi:predicted DNA-binding transcriptional regulator AlpA